MDNSDSLEMSYKCCCDKMLATKGSVIFGILEMIQISGSLCLLIVRSSLLDISLIVGVCSPNFISIVLMFIGIGIKNQNLLIPKIIFQGLSIVLLIILTLTCIFGGWAIFDPNGPFQPFVHGNPTDEKSAALASAKTAGICVAILGISIFFQLWSWWILQKSYYYIKYQRNLPVLVRTEEILPLKIGNFR